MKAFPIMRAKSTAILITVIAAFGLVTAPAAHASKVVPAYTAGSARPGAPGYDPVTWRKLYNCAFAGWVPVGVGWECWLYDPSTHTRLGPVYSGTFSGSGYTTPTYSFPTGNAYLCAEAYAAYSDGSASATGERCA